MTAPAPGSLRFPRKVRLQQRCEFTRLKEVGRRVVTGCLVVNWMVLSEGSLSKVGVVTSHHIGPSVVRNRARRLLRETFRRRQHDLRHPVSMVLVARKSIVGKPYSAVERDYLRSLRQAGLLKDMS